jgi:hypothetical protein
VQSAGTTLAEKTSASHEVLQLEIGCIGNPLDENFEELQLLAKQCWAKSLFGETALLSFQNPPQLSYTTPPAGI